MPRRKITYTQPGTVAHGYIIEAGSAEFVSYDLEGSYLKEKTAENRVKRDYNRTFTLESLTHYARVYEMPISTFIQHAQQVDVIEKASI